MTATTVVIGTTGHGRKVHMGWKTSGQILCDATAWGAAITDPIAVLADNGGEPETLAILQSHKVAVSQLCCHCFSLRLRARLAKLRKMATA